MRDLEQLREALIAGEWKTAAAATQAALAGGAAPLAIVTEHLMPAMDEVGRRLDVRRVFRARDAALRAGHEGIDGDSPPAAGIERRSTCGARRHRNG